MTRLSAPLSSLPLFVLSLPWLIPGTGLFTNSM
jgi:hypothetical protein